MSPLPMTSIPTLPLANCCLWQVHKKFEGARRVELQHPYRCDTGMTQCGRLRLQLKFVSAGPPCDQDPGLIPDSSILRASGVVIRRVDGLADFVARFAIISPRRVVLFRGAMELLDRIGTHHAPFGPEPCNPQSHVEGWLVGQGGPTLPNHTLRLLFVARGHLPEAGGPFPLSGIVNGVLVKCP